MKNIFFCTFLVFISVHSFSQVTYDKGYITDQAGQTTTVFIRFNEMAGNPTQIHYKSSTDGEVKTADIRTVKEFGIGDFHKYTRETVNIDRSSDDFKVISQVRNPEFKEEVLFLKTLVSGENSLLYYHDGDIKKFFIRTPDGDVEQLVYKKYTTGDNIIRKNNYYRQQLLNLLVCEDISKNDLNSLRYQRQDLVGVFQKYHECIDHNYEVHYSAKKGDLNLMIKAGVNITNFGMEQDVYDVVEDFQYQIDPRIGLEIEYMPPMVNQKIAIYLEPSFSMYKAEKEIIIATTSEIPSNPGARGGYKALVSMNYKILDLPLGFRYYMYINEANTSKMFVNAGASVNVIFNSSQIINRSTNENSDFDFNQTRQPTFFGGVGYRYGEKLSLEVRYFSIRPLTGNGGHKLHQNHSFALVAGYTLF